MTQRCTPPLEFGRQWGRKPSRHAGSGEYIGGVSITSHGTGPLGRWGRRGAVEPPILKRHHAALQVKAATANERGASQSVLLDCAGRYFAPLAELPAHFNRARPRLSMVGETWTL